MTQAEPDLARPEAPLAATAVPVSPLAPPLPVPAAVVIF